MGGERTPQPLATVDRVNAVGQLAALGLAPAQITKRTRAKRAEVDAALTVTGSELAREATARYHLTIDQAASVSEFDEDAATVKALVAATRTGQFDHVLQRARDGQPLDVDAHRTCPGHAVHLAQEWTVDAADTDTREAADDEDQDQDEDQDTGDQDDTDFPHPFRSARLVWTATAYCLDPDTHGHRSRWGRPRPAATAGTPMTDTQRATAAADRRTVIDNNKA